MCSIRFLVRLVDDILFIIFIHLFDLIQTLILIHIIGHTLNPFYQIINNFLCNFLIHEYLLYVLRDYAQVG